MHIRLIMADKTIGKDGRSITINFTTIDENY
jgi:hypothetical protein